MANAEKKYGKVAVLMGGESAEREISIESGSAVYTALLNLNIDAHLIDVDKNLVQNLINGGYDRIFIALHGKGGEDGKIQGLLESMNLPYTGSGVLGSALSMDKCKSKQIWKVLGLNTPDFMELSTNTNWKSVIQNLGLPLMVKPVNEGSSFGACKVTREEMLKDAWLNASQYDDRVMAECWISGNEYTVPVLDGEILPMIKLETPRVFYDYKAKYEDENTRYICPCGLSDEIELEIGNMAMTAFNALDASGWGRIDLIIDDNHKPWLIELNTVPGMTGHSLVPMSAKQSGMSFDELVLKILDTSMEHNNG